MNDLQPRTRQTPTISPGQRIRVTQSIFGREVKWQSYVEGMVESCQPETTGSWYAHGKSDKLWLLRVRLVKNDGERTTLVIDHNSRVEILT